MPIRNPNRRRIDARDQSDPAVQSGLRNIHRDMRGNVIGGVAPSGERVGTKRGRGVGPTKNQGGDQAGQRFSGLRKWARMNSGMKMAGEKGGSHIGQPTPKASPSGSSARAGASSAEKSKKFSPIGKAQHRDGTLTPTSGRKTWDRGKTTPATGERLRKRKALFAEMEATKGQRRSFNLDESIIDRAKDLGVTRSGLNAADSRIHKEWLAKKKSNAEKHDLKTSESGVINRTAQFRGPQGLRRRRTGV